MINYDRNGNKGEEVVKKVNEGECEVDDDYEKVNESGKNDELEVKLSEGESGLNEGEQ
ncbi:hypothetical protein [Staphylococcus epidermidis]|uniref:hypothetical protein n=1 Tax=Staphylococcus epidermidis TaxID=1282 RepID=UPI00164354BB|nr:hypothetical protein [Staphylococcus epidermidis]